LNPGDTFEVTVEEVRAGERKISLGTGEGNERESDDWKQYRKPSAPAAGGGLGSLGAKLQQALKEKNSK
jgi:small subunit ribosomal protein S1